METTYTEAAFIVAGILTRLIWKQDSLNSISISIVLPGLAKPWIIVNLTSATHIRPSLWPPPYRLSHLSDQAYRCFVVSKLNDGVGVGLVSCSLKEAALAFSSMWMLPVIHGFWLGYVRTVTVGTTSSMHLLMKPMTEVVYSSMPLDESRNIF